MPSLKKRTLATAIAAGALAAAAVAPTANAAFTSPFVPKCSGASITGAGASFQNTLQAGWIAGFGGAGAGIYCDNTQFTNSNTNSRGSFDTDKVDLLASPPIPLKTVAYTGGGSGAGLTSMGANLATNTNPNHLRERDEPLRRDGRPAHRDAARRDERWPAAGRPRRRGCGADDSGRLRLARR